jgi:urea transport system permease protein
VIGAILTNLAGRFFSENYPDFWIFFIGAVFVIVVLFLPGGLMSLFEKLRRKKKGGTVHEKETIAS